MMFLLPQHLKHSLSHPNTCQFIAVLWKPSGHTAPCRAITGPADPRAPLPRPWTIVGIRNPLVSAACTSHISHSSNRCPPVLSTKTLRFGKRCTVYKTSWLRLFKALCGRNLLENEVELRSSTLYSPPCRKSPGKRCLIHYCPRKSAVQKQYTIWINMGLQIDYT